MASGVLEISPRKRHSENGISPKTGYKNGGNGVISTKLIRNEPNLYSLEE